jgi:hypothetical protein
MLVLVLVLKSMLLKFNVDVDAIVGTVIDDASNTKVCELSEASVVHFKFLGTIFSVYRWRTF